MLERETAVDKKRKMLLESISDKPNKCNSTFYYGILIWTEHKNHLLLLVLPLKLNRFLTTARDTLRLMQSDGMAQED